MRKNGGGFVRTPSPQDDAIRKAFGNVIQIAQRERDMTIDPRHELSPAGEVTWPYIPDPIKREPMKSWARAIVGGFVVAIGVVIALLFFAVMGWLNADEMPCGPFLRGPCYCPPGTCAMQPQNLGDRIEAVPSRSAIKRQLKPEDK